MKYYIYKVLVNDEVVYVGKGKGKRYEHTLSGKSHNSKLNELYFRYVLLGEDKPVVEIYPMFDEDMALSAEHMYVLVDDPVCNVDLKTTTPKWYTCDNDEDIRSYVQGSFDHDYYNWRELLRFTDLSEQQLGFIYDEVCEYENPSDLNILSIATYSSIIYNVKVSCELVNSLVICKDYKAGV